jgi:hypothetical protein
MNEHPRWTMLQHQNMLDCEDINHIYTTYKREC